MARYQTWRRLAVLIVCSVAISGCFNDEPSAADIKASLSEAYGCAPELFNEIKVTNVIPNNEHTKYIDFEWSITYKPSDSIIKLMELSLESNTELNKLYDSQPGNPEQYDHESRKIRESFEEKHYSILRKLRSEMEKSNINKCYGGEIKYLSAKDELERTILKSAKNLINAITVNSANQDSNYIINNLLTDSWSTKRVLMIKTKNGWRFDSTGTD